MSSPNSIYSVDPCRRAMLPDPNECPNPGAFLPERYLNSAGSPNGGSGTPQALILVLDAGTCLAFLGCGKGAARLTLGVPRSWPGRHFAERSLFLNISCIL